MMTKIQQFVEQYGYMSYFILMRQAFENPKDITIHQEFQKITDELKHALEDVSETIPYEHDNN